VSFDDLVEPEDPIDNGLQLDLVEPAANEGDRCFEPKSSVSPDSRLYRRCCRSSSRPGR
jgi:hypothetical protein